MHNNTKAEITAVKAEVMEAVAARDRAMADWRITSEVWNNAGVKMRIDLY
jgi:hypothetical protein